MCGIAGIYSSQPVAQALYASLIHLQHRGQDAAGIVTCHQRFDHKTGLGLVQDIFTKADIQSLHGNMGIAHTRYPTAGGYSSRDVQPIWLGNPRGIALAHNGNLVNHRELSIELTENKHRHMNSSMDSEVLLHLLADELSQPHIAGGHDEAFFDSLSEVVKSLFERLEGSCSIVSIVMGKGMLAFRDPHGIRPLVMGSKLNERGEKDYIFASENSMFYSLGFEPDGDVQNGELVFINLEGKLFRKTLTAKPLSPCMFEYVYFARPDATLDRVSVYRARMRMGQNLAKSWRETHPNFIPDVIIPVPFTSNTAAMSMARELNIPYSEGLYKNPFIGRTFIMSDQENRSQQVRYKLSPQRIEIENKKVLLVDDSIVRGTTSREIVKMVREFGATEVYLASCCPPVKEPCFYGIDVPSRKELLAANMNLAQIQDYLGLDALLYQTEDNLVEALTRKGKHKIDTPCMACLNGKYISGSICESKKISLQQERQHSKEVA